MVNWPICALFFGMLDCIYCGGGDNPVILKHSSNEGWTEDNDTS